MSGEYRQDAAGQSTEREPSSDGEAVSGDSIRAELPGDSRPSRISFIAFPCTLPDGTARHLSAHIDVLDGDVQSAIEIVRRNGGILVPGADESGTQYFLPWPCALVEIRELPAAEAGYDPA